MMINVKKLSFVAVFALLALISTGLSAETLSARLEGFEGGNTNASGMVVLTMTDTTINSTFLTNGLGDVTAAQILAVSDDSILIDLQPSFEGGFGSGSVTVQATEMQLLMAGPSSYYVRVDTSAFPSGAIKGVIGASGETEMTELYFPVEAAISGQAGTQWKSDMRLVNRGAAMATIKLEYYAEGAAGNVSPTATSTEYSLNPGSELVLDDFVNAEFGISNGKGAVKVISDVAVDGTSKIYNDQRDVQLGTLGQQVPAMRIEQASDSGIIPMLSNLPAGTGEGFRSNLGYFNPGSEAVNLSFSFYAADGSLLATSTETIGAMGLVQKGADQFASALANVGEFYAMYSASAPIFVYGGLIDNVNGDSIYIPAID